MKRLRGVALASSACPGLVEGSAGSFGTHTGPAGREAGATFSREQSEGSALFCALNDMAILEDSRCFASLCMTQPGTIDGVFFLTFFQRTAIIRQAFWL